MELRPLTADLREAAATFASRIPERDRGFLDPFLFYQVAVSSGTHATPARRIAAVETEPDTQILGLVTVIPGSGWGSPTSASSASSCCRTRGVEASANVSSSAGSRWPGSWGCRS